MRVLFFPFLLSSVFLYTKCCPVPHSLFFSFLFSSPPYFRRVLCVLTSTTTAVGFKCVLLSLSFHSSTAFRLSSHSRFLFSFASCPFIQQKERVLFFCSASTGSVATERRSPSSPIPPLPPTHLLYSDVTLFFTATSLRTAELHEAQNRAATLMPFCYCCCFRLHADAYH